MGNGEKYLATTFSPILSKKSNNKQLSVSRLKKLNDSLNSLESDIR